MKADRFEKLRSEGVDKIKKMELEALSRKQSQIVIMDLIGQLAVERQQSESEITILAEIVARRDKEGR